MSFENPKSFKPAARETNEVMEHISAHELRTTDWIKEYGAMVAWTDPVDDNDIKITFFENTPEPVKVSRDKVFEVIRQSQDKYS